MANMEPEDIKIITELASPLLQYFGYETVTIATEHEEHDVLELCLLGFHQNRIDDNQNGKALKARISKFSMELSSPEIVVNENFCIRPPDDRFGRGITDLRHSLTSNDTKPFECM